jgi:uncharacterized DUF497 family protein
MWVLPDHGHSSSDDRRGMSLAGSGFRSYINRMRITFDPAKRRRTLEERGLDFEDAKAVFRGTTVEIDDTRKDYGERRVICFGMLAGRMVVVGYTPRGDDRHVFSMRKANDREKERLAPWFEVEPGAG